MSKCGEFALSSVFVWLLLPAVVLCVQLPPEVQADRYLLQAERAIQEQDFAGAKAAMDEILELQTQHDFELPDEFSFRYAEVLERLGLYDEAIEIVTRYLAVVGRDGAYYREALELLDSAEETLRRAEADRRLAEAERRRAEARQREHDELVRRQLAAAARPFPRDAMQAGGFGPELVEITGGRFQYRSGDLILQWVEFDKPFAISKYEVTRGEFERFVKSTRYRTDAERDPNYGCHGYETPTTARTPAFGGIVQASIRRMSIL